MVFIGNRNDAPDLLSAGVRTSEHVQSVRTVKSVS